MDGTRLFILALICSFAIAGGLVVTAQDQEPATMSVMSDSNTSEYLAPQATAINRAGQQTTTIDVAGAVGANAGAVRTTYLRVSIERDYREAENTTEQQRIVLTGVNRLEQRISRLEETQNQAISQYQDGQIGEQALLRTLSTVDREARALMEPAEWLENRASGLGMTTSDEQLQYQESRLHTLRGPVRAEVDTAFNGEEQTRVHIDVSDRGLVLAAIDDNNGNDPVYRREAYDPSARTTTIDEETDTSLSTAEARIWELYPWVIEDNSPTAQPFGPDFARLWQFSYAHEHGQLTTYIDMGSQRVLKEHQQKDPSLVPTDTEETSEDDIQLVLNRTRAGGPLGITVYDATTSDQVDAEITLNDDPVGSTNGDRLWTVAPRGTVTINATTNGDTLTHQTSFQ